MIRVLGWCCLHRSFGPYVPCPHKQGGQNQSGLEVWILGKVEPAAQV